MTSFPKTAISLAAAISSLATTAHSAVYVDFSGGNRDVLSITLPEIQWEVTNAAQFNALEIVFVAIEVGQTPANQQVGSSTGGDPADWTSTGSLTFSKRTDYLFHANSQFSPATGGSIIWLGLDHSRNAANGDVITYAGGTIGNDRAVSQSFTDGFYEVSLIDVYGARVGTQVIPEPSSLVLGALGIFCCLRRRR
eukprot:g3959.t1